MASTTPFLSPAAPTRSLAAGMAALAFAACLTTRADAQGARFGGGVYYNQPDLVVSPRSVVYRLADRGYSEIAPPRFDGASYIVDATGPAGARVRLLVDARDGMVVARRRLEPPFGPGIRIRRPVPGYGWTEDEARGDDAGRVGAGLIPPGRIPGEDHASLRPPRGADRLIAPVRPPVGEDGFASSDPDGRARSAKPRRTAKLVAPPRAAQPGPVPATAPPPIPEAPTREEDGKAPVAKTPAAQTPAALQPTPEAQRPTDAAATASAERSAAPSASTWKDPPSDEARRKVRVIDGATVVPAPGAN